MLYLVANYWAWMVVALVLGGAVGWSISPARRRRDRADRWLWWAAAAFLVGLIVAILRWLPGRPGLYLETLLLLSFPYMVGYLLVRLLRGAATDDRAVTRIAAEQAGLAVASAPPDRVRPTPASAAADARAAEEAKRAADAKAAEEAKRAADAKAAEEAKRAAEAKAAAEAKRAADAKAAAEAKRAAEAKAAAEAKRAAEAKAAAEAKRAADAKAAEEAKRAADAKAAEEAKRAADAKAAAEAKRAAEAKAAAEAKRAAEAKAAEETKRAAEAKAAEEAKRAADAKAAAEAKRAADAKASVEAKRAADAKASVEAKRATDAKAAAEAKRAAEAKAAEEAKRAADTETATEAKRTDAPAAASAHPGTKPPGLAAPRDGQADDLKRIKGIGPKNEKVCNALGVFHFSQIADWTSDEATWVGHHIAFPGRIEREHWIAQARLLAAGGETEHSAGVRAGTITVDETADAPLDAAAAAALGDSLPRQAPPVEGEAKHPGRRPYGLAAPLGGQPDDLKRIKGIGPKNEERLHALGIWRFAQIAAWTPDNVKWVGAYLAFPGRIDRERWITQAKDLTRPR